MCRKIFTVLLFISGTVQELQAQWPSIEQHMKPWTRWWWMGSAVDSGNIKTLIESYESAGFGGVEIVPIYGAKGYEENYISYLSPHWMKMLDLTVETANRHQMGVYISDGTGWPIGGKQVSVNDAASNLLVRKYFLPQGSKFDQKIIPEDTSQQSIAKLSVLMAYGSDGSVKNITPFARQDGWLQWQDTVDNNIIAAFTGKTKQLVKRAAPGGEGYTLDPFSYEALNNYLKSFDTAFGNTMHGVQAFYNDSYEVYDANWTPGFFDAFKKSKGYDLRLYFDQFLSDKNNDTVAAIKCDYRDVLSDLLLHNFTEQFSNWSHQKKALSLNQAHGSPGNLLDLYAATDIPETEMFGANDFQIPGLRKDTTGRNYEAPDPFMMKFASSAAHTMGKPYTSCETFTWLGEHFMSSWAQCKPEVEIAFLAGINHMFYHGTTYSPSDAKWPGWLFYASLNVVPDNSLWPHINALNTYISRCQSILQQGEPDNEILVYWPVYDIWQNAKGMEIPLQVHNLNEWLYPADFYKEVNNLHKKGFTLDYASDVMLTKATVDSNIIKVTASGAAYKVLLIPNAEFMPQKTIDAIINIAKQGAAVILKTSQFKIPGFANKLNNKSSIINIVDSADYVSAISNSIKVINIDKGRFILCSNTEKALAFLKQERELLTDYGLQFIRRTIPGGKYYYLVNHTANVIDTLITFEYMAGTAIILDPQSGAWGQSAFSIGNSKTKMHIRIEPGETLFVKLLKDKKELPAWKYYEDTGNKIPLKGKWKLHFIKGGPYLPANKNFVQPVFWTKLTNDSTTQYFSGTGVYATNFMLSSKRGNEAFILKLDSLFESARIIVNNLEAGYIWSVPYKLDITSFLRAGNNTIEIEVANLMANRIRYMDQHNISWKNYHDINFADINYKPFDASAWKVQPSGLGSTPIIHVMKIKKQSDQ